MLLGVGLSFLFTGMAIKRFFEGILKSLFQTFLMVEGEGGAVNDKINELMATLAFLKFTLIDAFVESGGLDKWIDRIERLIDWFVNLDDTSKSSFVNMSINAIIFGGALMIVGQTLLFLLGILALLKYLGMGKVFAGWTPAIGKVALGLLGWVLALFTLLFIIPRLIRSFGGFGNFAKAVIAGIIKAVVLLGDFLVNGLIVILESLMAIAARIAQSIAPGSAVAAAMREATMRIGMARMAWQTGTYEAMEAIDKTMGSPETRETIINNNVTIQGNADEDVIESMINKLEERLGLAGGSPQQ
jgi:hypothetical protein